jgi:DhnA family fructose-bisphosphate aldolase class Ia
LCACATSGQQHVAATPAPEDKLNGDFDQGKVATVNRWALDHGATVIWTHYPQKRKGTDGG